MKIETLKTVDIKSLTRDQLETAYQNLLKVTEMKTDLIRHMESGRGSSDSPVPERRVCGPSALQTLNGLLEAWHAKDFDQARALLITTCENLIALEDFQAKVLFRPEAAMGIIDLFHKTGIDQAPEGSAPEVIFKRFLGLSAGALNPAPGETIH